MDTEETTGTRGPMLQCVIALAIIVLAFRIADVSPSAAFTTAPAAPAEPAWAAHVAALDDALLRHDLATAAERWQAARTATYADGGWEGLVALGDASRRLAEAKGSRPFGDAQARTLYLDAFFRARRLHAVDGLLRVATAFADLGDRQVVAQCLRIADAFAVRSGDLDALARVRALGGQLAEK